MQRDRFSHRQRQVHGARALACSSLLLSLSLTLGASSSFGQEYVTLCRHERVTTSIAFSADGKTLAACCGTDEIILWDVASRKRQRVVRVRSSDRGHQGVYEIAISPDGKTLVGGGYISTVRSPEDIVFQGAIWFWNIESGKLERTLLGHDMILSLALSPDGKVLATSGYRERDIKFWDVETGSERQTVRGHKGTIHRVAFSPDGKTLASAGGYGIHEEGGDPGVFDSLVGELMLWDVATGNRKLTMKGHTYYIYSVAFSSDGESLASLTREDIRLWDTQSGRMEGVIEERFLKSLAISPDGKTVVSVGYDLIFWNIQTQEEERRNADQGFSGQSVIFSPDGKKLATGSGDGEVRLWDVDNPRQ